MNNVRCVVLAILATAAKVTARDRTPPPACPSGTVEVDVFSTADADWRACENLDIPNGGLALIQNEEEDSEWFPKTYEPYLQGNDSAYYLGLGRETVLKAKWDMLGQKLLCNNSPRPGFGFDVDVKNRCEPTFDQVKQALPPMRYSGGDHTANMQCSTYAAGGGVRTFVSSRSTSVDSTFSDHADDCSDNGFPRPQSYVMNLTAIANGEPPITDFNTYINFTGMAEGLVGRHLPTAMFYFPILPQNFSTFTGSRYWSMMAVPVPDMKGSREQSVWFRFQQLVCAGLDKQPPCHLHGKPQYYDTYWYSSNPITTRWIRPDLMANASGFYANLLASKQYWDETLRNETMMELDLPDVPSNNGTLLNTQAVFSFVRSMISRDDTWHPRYGVLPGYGVTLQDGFQDTFTSTATAAVEWGAVRYAKGVIDNWLSFYVRNNGMVTYRAEELHQSGRMLTIFALYVSYTNDTELMLQHFDKAKVLAEWLIYRRSLSLTYPTDDPRYGLPSGGDEGDGYIGHFEGYGSTPLQHFYSCAGAMYRGFDDIGQMWMTIGKETGREDIVAHAKELLALVPVLKKTIQTSLSKTTFKTGNPAAPRCIPTAADPVEGNASCQQDTWFRSYSELMYTGVLTYQQADDMYNDLSLGNKSILVTRPLTLGCTGYNNKQVTYIAYGMAYGLLQHDMVDRFLLHFYSMALHTYTRATWTTPEAVSPDRDVASTDYVAAGVVTAPTYLKWAMMFEEPVNRTLWVGKALARDWLAAPGNGVKAKAIPTRYGRIDMAYTPAIDSSGVYSVTVVVSFSATSYSHPDGGVRVRVRAPLKYAGRMSSVVVNDKPWSAFNAEDETIDFMQPLTTPKLTIKATFK